MEIDTNKNKLIAGAAIAALVLGGGGVLLGRTIFAPTTTASAEAEKGEAGEEDHGPEGFVEIDDARARAAGIATEATLAGGLGAEIIAQGFVAAAPDGEAVLTARADGALTRIVKRLGDSVSAGETIAYLESRDAGTIAAERSSGLLPRAQPIIARKSCLMRASPQGRIWRRHKPYLPKPKPRRGAHNRRRVRPRSRAMGGFWRLLA